MQPRMREPLDLVGKVGSLEFARAGLAKIGQGAYAGEIICGQRLIAQPAGRIPRESRMRLVAHARTNANFIDAVGHAGRVGGHFAILIVKVDGLG